MLLLLSSWGAGAPVPSDTRGHGGAHNDARSGGAANEYAQAIGASTSSSRSGGAANEYARSSGGGSSAALSGGGSSDE